MGRSLQWKDLSESLHFELEPLGIRVKIIEPGMINTDFGGRSFVFETGTGLPEYLPAIEGMQKAMQHYAANLSSPGVVADVIWQAVNDSTNTLRYRAGDDAHSLLNARKEQDDATFISSCQDQSWGGDRHVFDGGFPPLEHFVTLSPRKNHSGARYRALMSRLCIETPILVKTASSSRSRQTGPS